MEILLLLSAMFGLMYYGMIKIHNEKAMDAQINAQAVVDALNDLTRALQGGE